MNPDDYFNWNDKAIKTLRAGWAAGLSVNAISRLLKCSRNAVVGKKNRLKLPSRPDPIRRGKPAVVKPARAKAGAKTRPALGPLTIAHAGTMQPVKFVRFDNPDPKYPPRVIEREAPIVDALPLIHEADERVSEPMPLPIFKPRVSRHECQYPTTFTVGRHERHKMLCDKPAINGPYCDEHRALCWEPTKAQQQARQ